MIRQHLRQKLPSQVQFIGMEPTRPHREILSDSCPTFIVIYPGYPVQRSHVLSLLQASDSVTSSMFSEVGLCCKLSKHCVPY